VPCKRRSSANSAAWLQRFDDVTAVEKSYVVKAKKVKEKCYVIATFYAFPPNMECMNVCYVKKFYTFTTVKTYFFAPNHCETQITKNYQTSK